MSGSGSILRLRQRSLLFWLLMVQLLAVLPVLGFAGWAVYHLGQRNQQDAIADLQGRVAVAADSIAREADRVKTRLELLAGQQAARSGDVDGVRRLAVELMALDSSIAGASALDRAGQLVFTTHRPEGTALPRLPMPPGDAHVFEKDAVFVSGLTPGELNDVALIGFAAPWRVAGEGTRYALRMSLKPEELGRLLREQRWPRTWTAALVDQNLVIVARSRDEAAHFGKPATESLQRFVRSGAKGVDLARTKDGTEVVTAASPVRDTPWWVVAGLPSRDLAEEVAGPFRQLVAGGLLLTVLGIAASLALSRYLSREMKQAARGGGVAEPMVREIGSIGARQLMLENELVGMVRLVQRRAVWHNPALEQIFGYGPGELAGHSPRQMHPDDASFQSFGQRAYDAISAGKRFREQLQMVRKDGSKIWVDVSGVELPDGSTLWMLLDVTAMRLEHERMTGLAFRDQLTGLANRGLLEDRLAQALATARRSAHQLAVCLLDLNGFKAVNDSMGHAAGDQLLRTIAKRLERCVRASDTVARIGGDEFVLLLAPATDVSEVQAVVARVRDAVRQEVVIDRDACRCTAAVGVSYYPVDGIEPEALLKVADSRMYADKALEKSTAGKEAALPGPSSATRVKEAHGDADLP